MDLTTTQQRDQLKVVDAEYTVETGHKVAQPVVDLFCRDEDRNFRHIEVEGFRPYFMIAYDEFVDRTSDVVNDRHVIAVEADLSTVEWDDDGNLVRGHSEDPESVADALTTTANGTQVYHDETTFDALDGTKLVKIYTIEPSHVGKIRDHWDRTWEADVPFTRRFMISSGIYHGVEVPAGAERVRYENWDGHSSSSGQVREIEGCDPPDVELRMLVTDIEVRTNGGGVPDPADANNQITAITTYDNYTEDYAGWILTSEEWDETPEEHEFRAEVLDEMGIDLETMAVFDHEGQMIEDFHQWVLDRNFDLVTGWNCIPHDEEVLMADGSRVPIEDVSIGDDVVGIDDGEATVATVENKMMTGVKETVEIQTNNGENLHCTPDHEVLVGTDDGVGWTEARDITDGDFVLTVKNHPSGSTESPVSPQRAYQYGLIASDGSLGYGEGVRFYNTRDELHDQFETDNAVTENVDGSKSQRVFTNQHRDDSVAELESVGIPAGSKKDNDWDLSVMMSWDDDLIASFLAGMMDGDGTVSNNPSIAAANESCRYWIKRLCRRLGIWATSGETSVHIGRSSVERFAWLVGERMNHSEKRSDVMQLSDSKSGRSKTIPGVFVTDGKDTSGDGDFHRVNEYLSRNDVSLKRHHAESVGSNRADEYTDFVFDKVTDVVEDGEAVCYDIETDASSYVASERVVHNCNGFDYPYIIQRSYNTSAYSIRDWDYMDSPFNAGDEWPEPVIEGVVLFDMLDAYKKTQYRDLRSYKLEDVAQAELGMGKVQLEESLDDAWHKKPIEFMRYNVRDVEAVVEIEQSSELIDLYDNMRQVTGAQYNTCNHNGPMLDTLFLRMAYDEGIALTTNYEPDQGDYHGAWVAEPVPGKHENVVYPDLASLYPYILWTLNISPETMFTDEESYRGAGFTEDQMFTAYIDKRDWYVMSSGDTLELSEIDEDQYKGVHDESGSRKKKTSQGFDGIFEPQFHEIYFVKPSVQEGFIRKTVDLLVDLKYRYKGQGDMYAAVKRVTNSIYGVLGDSASGGKGFRLFDWRLAEAITLGGQKVIQYTADQYIDIIEELAADDGYDVNPYMVGGDTDSVQSAIPEAPDYETALRWSQEASEIVGERYDWFMEQEFNVVAGEDEHKMDVEIESLGSSLFFMQDGDNPDTAVKKRYAQHMIWDEDDGWLDESLRERNDVSLRDYESGPLSTMEPSDNIGIKGFEYVRSDSATVTKEAQLNVLTYILLTDDPADRIHTYLSDLDDEIYSDGFDMDRLGRPKSITNPIDDYGWKTTEELENDSNYTVTEKDERHGGRYVSTPSPTYRGAKYADDHIPWEDLSEGSKPIRFYVDTVRGDKFPAAYRYDSYPKDSDRPDPPEVKRTVDAIAVDDPSRIPREFVLDVDKMVQKELEDKIQPILRTIGEDWDSLVGNGRQVGLDAF